MSATHAATSSAVGGSPARMLCRCRSVSRTEPTSIETTWVGARSPRMSSVEPPPMSTTNTGGAGGRASDRTAPSKASAASSSPDTTSGSMPSRARTPATKTSALRASRVADVAQKRTRRGAVVADQHGVLVERGERPLQRSRRELARAVDALTEADHPHLADGDLGQRADQQLDRVGAAVDGGDHRDGRCRAVAARPPQPAARPPRTGPRPTSPPSASSTSSPSGFTPGPWASDCAGQDVQALDPVGHPAGGDALDLRHRARARPGAAEVALVSALGTPPPARARRRAGPASASSGRTPRASRCATPPAGTSGRTSSGTAFRSAAAARW